MNEKKDDNIDDFCSGGKRKKSATTNILILYRSNPPFSKGAMTKSLIEQEYALTPKEKEEYYMKVLEQLYKKNQKKYLN